MWATTEVPGAVGTRRSTTYTTLADLSAPSPSLADLLPQLLYCLNSKNGKCIQQIHPVVRLDITINQIDPFVGAQLYRVRGPNNKNTS